MAVKRPTLAQLHEVSRDLGMTLSDEDARSFLGLMEGSFAAYDAVDAMPDYVPPVKYPRTPGYRPEGAENRYNAWYVKTTVKGAPSGKLAGKTVALKDNICLAGVPMMNGASTLRGYVPDIDATVVTRILDAGGTIVGKARPQSAPDGSLGGGIILRVRGPRGRRRGGHGPWRRPGWVDPHSVLVLRHLRHEADPWPGPVHRHHAYRTDARSHGADDGLRGRQRAAARGHCRR